MSAGYYTRATVAPQFRISHGWTWIWYRAASGSFPYDSGKWVVS